MVPVGDRPLGLLYLAMVILRVSYGYGLRVYPRVGSGTIFGTGRIQVLVTTIEYGYRGTGR